MDVAPRWFETVSAVTALGTMALPCRFSVAEMRALLGSLFHAVPPAMSLSNEYMTDYAAVRAISSYEELRAYIVQLDSVTNSDVYRESKETVCAMLVGRLLSASSVVFPPTMQRDPLYASMSRGDIRSRAESVLLTCALWSVFGAEDESPELTVTLSHRDVSTRRLPQCLGH
jgi:hypothetical protein